MVVIVHRLHKLHSREKDDHSSIAGGIANWHNHSGNQSGGSSENWKSIYLKTQLLDLSPHPRQHVLSPEVLILAFLIGVRWNLRVVLICISLITKNFRHFFKYFLTICESSVVNSLFKLCDTVFNWGIWFFWRLTSGVLCIF
jgi:hypothetical protein